MWNLVKGCKSTTRKLNDKPTKILFNPDGSRYAILYYNCVKVYNISDGQEAFEITNRMGLNDMVFWRLGHKSRLICRTKIWWSSATTRRFISTRRKESGRFACG